MPGKVQTAPSVNQGMETGPARGHEEKETGIED